VNILDGVVAAISPAWAWKRAKAIRWGSDTSSDMLRRCARCQKCGHKGATLQHPGWIEDGVGWAPFPVGELL